MRKLLLVTALLSFTAIAFGQKLDEIKEMIGKGQWDKAKDGIDKFLAVDKNAKSADGWYQKAIIYNGMAKDERFSSMVSNGRADAFAAYKKYLELDSKNVLGTLSQNVLLFDLYNGYFEQGAKGFNGKDYKSAFENFKSAEEVQQFIYSKDFSYNGFKFSKLDTSLVLNTAIAAANAKMDDEAMAYYGRLAEAKLSDKSYNEVYRILVDYYMKKNDDANAKKYLALGQELFPKDDYWLEVQLETACGNKDDKTKCFAKYEELIQKNPDNYALPYNMAVEIYNILYTGDNKPANAAELEPKMIKALDAAIKIRPESADASLLMARYYYNKGFDYSDEARKIRSTKPEDVKKKNDLNAKMTAELDKAIPYAEKAAAHFDGMTTFKPIEKANYKTALDILSRIYESKKMADKSKMYSDKLAALDK